MAAGSAFEPTYMVFGRMLAKRGVAVVLVDFRGCVVPPRMSARQGITEVAPFPGGLNDVYSGLQYVYKHAVDLGIDPDWITVAGESGGGNLTLATALKAKKEGRVGMIRGLYALCPYLAGSWPQQANVGILGRSHLNEENNGIFLNLGGNASAIAYGYEAFERQDPLAWPGFATKHDLTGLPPCVISVNECDPLRDEGLNFYRACLRAGVAATCREVRGTPHGGDLMVAIAPEIALATVQSIVDFACGVTSPGPTHRSRL